MRHRPVAGLVLFLVAAATVAAWAQEPVRGTVTDRETGAGIAGARVSAQGSGRVAWTDAAGSFNIAAGAGTDSLRVAAIGYGAVTVPARPGPVVVQLARLAVVLPEVVTTGGRFEGRAAEVTAPMSTISSEEITAQAAVAVDQIVSQLPGVQVIPVQPAGTSVAIRGIGESRVLILVDGEPVSGSLIENQDLSRLSTLAVDRIEVIKGPVSSEYGSDALGGVINIITQAPGNTWKMTALARAGSYGRLEGQATADGGTGRFRFRVSGGAREQDAVPGQVQGATPLERVYDVRATTRYTASSRLAFRADLNWLYERQRWPVGGGFNGFNDNEGISGFTEATLDAAGGLWRARFFGESYEYRYRSAEGDKPYANTGPPPQDERMLRGLVSHSRQAGPHAIDAGIQTTFRDVSAPDRIAGGAMSDDQVEAFAKDALRLGRVVATAGARYTWNSRWGDNIAPSLGAAWEPEDAVRLRASVARGFRAPSFKELGWSFGNVSAGYVVNGNPDLQPESSWSYDAAVAWSLRRDVVFELEGFRNDVQNLIDFSTIGTNEQGYLVFQPVNIGRARTQGVETGVRWNPRGWAFSLGYTWLDAKNLNDNLPLNRRAAHTARARATHTWKVLNGLRADVTGLYTSEAPLVGETDQGNLGVVGEQGAFMQWNLGFQLGVTPLLDLSAGVDNVFDQRPANWTGLIERRIWVGVGTRLQ